MPPEIFFSFMLLPPIVIRFGVESRVFNRHFVSPEDTSESFSGSGTTLDYTELPLAP